ncbi:MAG: thioredoxin domain-containing protein [Pseudaminobacter sp.]
MARTRPPSSDILDQVRLGEEIAFGNRTAPEIVVVFLDYECAHCAPSRDFIASLENPGARDLRVVVRFPAAGNLVKDSANVLLHCIYDRFPATFLPALAYLGSNPPGSQEDLKSFAQMAGLLTSDYQQCLGGTKAMQRILQIYQYNIELYGACLLVGCTTTLDSSGEIVNTVGIPLAIFGSNPTVGRSFRIARARSDPHWWRSTPTP